MKGDLGRGCWALVPVKPFSIAKRRLSTVLSPAQRESLAQAMLHDVLGVLAQSHELAGILVVTSDPDAVNLARGYGAAACRDEFDGGTNLAVLQGVRALDEQGRSAVMIVHGDVPLLTTMEVASVIESLDKSSIVIAPASRDGGVNLLAAKLPLSIEPCFGTDSFARHLDAARGAGLAPVILRLEGIGFDIDRADDIAAFDAATRKIAMAPTRTETLLTEFRKPAAQNRSAFAASPF